MLFLSALVISLLVASVIVFRRFQEKRKRAALLASSLNAYERNIIAHEVPLYRQLPDNIRRPLEGKINLFLHQVEFLGCDGLEVTEEMRLSIAAQACLLVVNRNIWFDTLRTLLIYPGAFKSVQPRRNGFVVTKREIIRAGESWHRGPVILSWAHSLRGAQNPDDGQNVVIHEFAHQIDDLTGQTNGVPLLAKGQRFADWENAILPTYEQHVKDVERGRKTVLDAYGAEGHEEFFAVGTETFFEKPEAMQKDMPEVYHQFVTLFGMNPLDWQAK